MDKFKLEKEDLLEFLRQLDYVLCQAAQHEGSVREMVKAKLAYESSSSCSISAKQHSIETEKTKVQEDLRRLTRTQLSTPVESNQSAPM